MSSARRRIANGAAVAALLLYAGICLHSVQEIHYLKSFFPPRFTVEEAFWAAGIELIKVILLGIPFASAVALYLLLFRRERGG